VENRWLKYELLSRGHQVYSKTKIKKYAYIVEWWYRKYGLSKLI